MEPDAPDQTVHLVRSHNWVGDAALVCGLLSILDVVVYLDRHLGSAIALAAAAVVLGVLGLGLERRGRARGSSTAAAGLGVGALSGGGTLLVMGVLSLYEGLGDWFFGNLTW